jgi:hypothetical protein
MKSSWAVLKGTGYKLTVATALIAALNRQRTLLRYALLRYGIAGTLFPLSDRKRSGPCPFVRNAWDASPEQWRRHRPDSFKVFYSRGRWSCSACQTEGRVVDFIAGMESVPPGLAAILILKWFPVPRLNLPARAKTPGR